MCAYRILALFQFYLFTVVMLVIMPLAGAHIGGGSVAVDPGRWAPAAPASAKVLASESPISALPVTSEEAPALDGSRVVWYDDRTHGPTDVWGYDLTTKQTFQVTSHPSAQLVPDISGEVVTFEDNRDGNWDIYAKRLDTGQEFAIATGPHDQRYPRVWGNYVVYQDEGTEYWQSDVYLYDRVAGTTLPLAVAHGFQGDPDIDGGWVVWRDNRDGAWQVRGYRLEEGTYHVLEPGGCGGELRRPRIGGGLVVWQNICDSSLATGYDIYGYVLSSATPTTIFVGPGDQEAPVASNSLVAWQDRDTNGNEDVFVYVRDGGAIFPVTLDPSQQIRPAVSGNTVVWQDNRSHTWDIYVLEWDGSMSPPGEAPISNPRDLQAGAFPGGTIRLNWTSTSTDELGFVVQRAVAIFGMAWTDYANVPSGVTVFDDQHTLVGESYWYRVRAYNASGVSTYSNETYSTAFDDVPNDDERYMHMLINEARMDPAAWGYPGLPAVDPLGWNPNLAYSTRAHALGMNNSNCCQSHIDLAGRGATERAAASGYPYGTGENLFQSTGGREGMEAAHRIFMDSEGHRANMLAADLRETAIGYAQGGRGTLVETFSGGAADTTVPGLPSGIVVPYTSTIDTPFDFLVAFWNPEQEAPSSASVVLDGESHVMSLRSGTAGRGTYVYSTTLPLGAHSYYFEFEWDESVQQARLPESGTFAGPWVRPYLPDLAVTSWSVDRAVAGRAGWVRATVQNRGELPSADATLQFYVGDPRRGGMPLDVVQPVPPLEPGDQEQVQVEWVPQNGWPQTLYAWIDPGDPEEIDQTNNLGEFVVAVQTRSYTWYVDGTVEQPGDGRTAGYAFKTIGEALDDVVPGDTIRVAPGIYQEKVSVPSGVHLLGSGAGHTTIDGGGSGGNLITLGAGAIIEDFTLANAGTDYFDAAVWHAEGDATVRGNFFKSSAVGVFTWCYEPDCTAVTHIEHNLFAGNSRAAIDASQDAIQVIRYNTIVNNTAGIIVNEPGTVVANNILAIQQETGITVNAPGAPIHHNLLWANHPDTAPALAGSQNLMLDPLLRDVANGDFHLYAGSPAIGRSDAEGTDLGALPFVPQGAAPLQVRAVPGDGSTWAIAWEHPGAAGYHVYWGRDLGLYTQRYDVGSSRTFALPAPAPGEQVFVSVSSYDDARRESEVSAPIAIPFDAANAVRLPLVAK